MARDGWDVLLSDERDGFVLPSRETLLCDGGLQQKMSVTELWFAGMLSTERVTHPIMHQIYRASKVPCRPGMGCGVTVLALVSKNGRVC